MTTHIPHQQTAKIYQFPVGGRASVGPRGREIKPLNLWSPNPASTTTPTVAGEGWYHEAAIQDAKRTTEH
jgi:hypothetical protein